ncbi:hypothetical protein FisN_4Lh007 [Fistulifera solaris]|uniref:Uncharacterized protein n=1 Tax=Fistulifera solaris TaxID=1519565 RepID=A0A1Z5KDU2_FISSO|nr:hypothetical protein FisN_4Lh007 [Fistulifera solaris]|eukprot:GAX24292.1 hypothetical protein FisN_4Lh007 [Fistulifera solaris]
MMEMEDLDSDRDTESDVKAHYIELVKSFYIDGFADEFEISGQQIKISDYGMSNDLGNAEGDEVVLAYRSLDFFWKATVPCVCACVAYFAYCKFYKPKTKTNREQNARKLDRLRKRNEAFFAQSLKGDRQADSKRGSKKKIVDKSLSGDLIAPELVVEKPNLLMPPDILVHGSVANLPFREDVQPPITVDALGDELVKTAQSFKKIIENSGMGGSEEMVSTLSWQAAMTLKQTAAICHATSIAETRGYIFQTQQSRLDREISARQHKELLTSIREDKLWPQKLVEARRECFAKLRVASLRSFALILSFKPFLIATGLLIKWKFHSIGDLVSEVSNVVSSLFKPRSYVSRF